MATIFIRRRPDSVMEWAIEDVVDWLKELKLDQYCKRFQSHLVSGPIILQMDDVLLDDLNITLSKERQLLLNQSRTLCLQELELVNQALEYKQNTADNSSLANVPSINITCEYIDDSLSDEVFERDENVAEKGWAQQTDSKNYNRFNQEESSIDTRHS
ncbi:hypothetical protein QZH41_019945, partial [Actinostola sp. cb2023]